MAVVEETRATPAAALPVADPAPLGLAAFALTTFMLSGHNANFIPDIFWVALALFYGGVNFSPDSGSSATRTRSERRRSRRTAGSASRSGSSSSSPRRRSSAAG